MVNSSSRPTPLVSSSEEEDYMSERFLNEAQGVHVDKCKPKKLLREIELEKKHHVANLVNSGKARKILQEKERKRALETKIDKKNVGYQMLLKMGFKDGQGLGVTKTGITEPIPIEIKKDRGGVGMEQDNARKLKAKLKRVRGARDAVSKDAFLKKMKLDKNLAKVRKDIAAAQKACQHLDELKGLSPAHPHFWPPEPDDDSTVAPSPIPEYDTTELLESLLNYLRSKHLYCLYCGTSFDDEADMENNCECDDET